MMNTLIHFLDMNGYGIYIWTAYSIVFVALGCQWFLPWRRMRKYLRSQHERHS